MNCKNCGEVISGSYCSNCGQASKVERITLSTLSRDFTEDVLQINKGFFYTVKELFTRPGHSIREYLDGKRKNYYRPIAYLLVLSTVFFLITKLTGQQTWISSIIEGYMHGYSHAKDENLGKPILPEVIVFILDNYAYTTLLLLPITAAASYISFPKAEANYLEHIVINAYITGQQAIIYGLSALILSITETDILGLLPILAFLYCFWVFYQFFKNGNRLLNIARTVLTYIIFLILCIVLLIPIITVSDSIDW